MDLDLTGEQREQLELISLHVGRPPARLLTEAALFLLSRDVAFWTGLNPEVPEAGGQRFLEEDELDARFARVLRR